MKIKLQKNKITTLFLFFFSPLCALPCIFVEIYNRKKYAITLLSLFLAICAYMYIPSGDLYRYWLRYKEYEKNDFSYLFDAYKLDYLVYILLWVFAKLELGHAFIRFFLVFVCSYLYLNISYIVLSKIKSAKKFFIFFLYSFFSFPFFGIVTGLRNASALIFILAGTYYLIYENKKFYGYLFLSISCLMHFAMIILVPFILLVKGNAKIPKFTALTLAFSSFFLTNILLSILPLFSEMLIYGKILAYTSGNDYVDTISPLLRLIRSIPIVIYIPLGYYVLFRASDNKFRNLIFFLLIFVCLLSPFKTPYSRYMAALVLIVSLAVCIDYKKVGKYLLLSLVFCSFLTQSVNALTSYKSILNSDYKSLIYTPYPFLFFKTYDSSWINQNVKSDGELLL